MSKVVEKLSEKCDINDTNISKTKDSTDVKPCNNDDNNKVDNSNTELDNQLENEVNKQADCVIDSDDKDVVDQVENEQSNDSENQGSVETETGNVEKLNDTEQDKKEGENVSDKGSGDEMTKHEEKVQDVGDMEQSETNEKLDLCNKSKRKWTIKRLKKDWRRFNLDLSPKVGNFVVYRYIKQTSFSEG